MRKCDLLAQYAVAKDLVACLRFLIILGFVDVRARLGARQWTLLHFAARFTSPKAVELLLREGADVNAETGPLETAGGRDRGERWTPLVETTVLPQHLRLNTFDDYDASGRGSRRHPQTPTPGRPLLVEARARAKVSRRTPTSVVAASAEYPRRRRGVAATRLRGRRLRGISTSSPRRRRDLPPRETSPRNINVVAAASPRFASAEYPRDLARRRRHGASLEWSSSEHATVQDRAAQRGSRKPEKCGSREVAELIGAVAAAGGWTAYVRAPRVELMHLRGLRQRGCVAMRPRWNRGVVEERVFGPSALAREDVPLPGGVAWQIFEHWRSSRDGPAIG